MGAFLAELLQEAGEILLRTGIIATKLTVALLAGPARQG